jgi:hypothetical protein
LRGARISSGRGRETPINLEEISGIKIQVLPAMKQKIFEESIEDVN